MKILLIAAGEKPTKELFFKYLDKVDKTIAIDAGVEVFLDNNLKPDYTVGDFDSVDERYKDDIELLEKFEYPSEKDFTDSDIGVKLAIHLGAKEIYMLGMTGKRIDHLFGNIGLLDRCLKENVRGYIIDKYNKMFLIDKSLKLSGNFGEVISFYAFSNTVKDFSIKNAKYELFNYELDPFENLCNSNEFLDEAIEVSFKSGRLLVIYSKE